MNECDKDELELLRQTRGATTEQSAAAFAAGRARLERQIRHRPSVGASELRRGGVDQKERRTRSALSIGAGIGLVGALVGVAVVLVPTPALRPVLGPAAPDDRHADAAELLEKAAEQVHFLDFAPRPGKLIRSDTYRESLIVPREHPRIGPEGNVSTDDVPAPSPVVFGTETRWVSMQTGDANADRSAQLEDTIVDVYGPRSVPVQLHFDAEERPAGSLIGDGVSPFGDWQEVPLEVLENGTSLSDIDSTYVDELGQEIAVPHFAPTRAESLPREPGELTEHARAVIAAAGVSGADEDRALFTWLVPLVTFDQTPADLRAAAFSALADLDGVVVSDSEVTLGDRTGTGISFESDEGLRTELVLDPENGFLIGSRTVLTEANSMIPTVPAGTVVSAYSVTYSVVTEMPCLSDLVGPDVDLNPDGVDPYIDDWCGDASPPE